VVVLEGANKEPAYTEDLKDKVETIETIRDEFGDQLTDDELLDVVEAILYGEGELPEPKTTDDETDQTTLNTTAEGEDEVIEEPDDCLSVEYVLDLLAEVKPSDPETWSADNDLTRADLERVFEILEPNDDERYDEEVRETLLANISPYWTLYIHSLIHSWHQQGATSLREESTRPRRERRSDPTAVPEARGQQPAQLASTEDVQRKPRRNHRDRRVQRRKAGSGHNIGSDSFSNDNDGAIPKNFIKTPNTASNTHYQRMCRKYGFDRHPARFPEKLPQFFVNLLTPTRLTTRGARRSDVARLSRSSDRARHLRRV